MDAVADDRSGPPPVHVVYALVGVLDVIVAFICLITSSLFPVDVVPPDHEIDQACSETKNTTDRPVSNELTQAPCAQSSRRQKTVLLLVVSLFFVVNGGRDALLSVMLFTYVGEYLGWTAASGTLLVTMYHVTRAVVHAILVPVSRWVSPARLTLFNVVTLVISSSVMLVSGNALTAVGVIVTGLATSNVHQTTIKVVAETVHVVAPVMAVFIMAIGLGQMVIAPLSGQLLQTSGAASFPAMLLALALAGLALFCVYCVLNQSVVVTCRSDREIAQDNVTSL